MEGKEGNWRKRWAKERKERENGGERGKLEEKVG